jgi:DNA-binding transcriptional LysR family regulator
MVSIRTNDIIPAFHISPPDHVTLKQLETFYWVHRLGGFAAAAKHLHSTQSAVSMRVQDLEAALGVDLFDRNHRSARLTAKGQELVEYAGRMMALTTEIRHRVADPSAASGTIRVGVTEFIALTWLSGLVRAVNEAFPAVVLELDIDLTLTLLHKLQGGALDLVMLPGPVDEPGLANVPLGSVRFDWMASPKLGVPRAKLSPRDLQKWPILTLSSHSNLHKRFARWFGQAGTPLHRAHSANSVHVLAALTIAGLGASYLPRAHFAPQIEAGELQVLDVSPRMPDLDYFAVYDRRPLQPLAQAIAELARKHSRFSSGAGRKPG